MINTARAKEILKARREIRDMTKAGFKRVEVDWELHRGGKWDHVVTDLKLAWDDKSVWVKTGPRP